jgi:hypothetical protein
VTDLHRPTLDNLSHNIALNDLPTEAPSEEGEATPATASASASPVLARYVNWCDPATYPSELADVVIGSDLVYDSGILAVLVPAVAAMLREGLSLPRPLLPPSQLMALSRRSLLVCRTGLCSRRDGRPGLVPRQSPHPLRWTHSRSALVSHRLLPLPPSPLRDPTGCSRTPSPLRTATSTCSTSTTCPPERPTACSTSSNPPSSLPRPSLPLPLLLPSPLRP